MAKNNQLTIPPSPDDLADVSMSGDARESIGDDLPLSDEARQYYAAIHSEDSKAQRLFEMLQAVTTKIDAGDSKELDTLLVKKLEIEELLDAANARLRELERQGIAQFSPQDADASAVAFSVEEEEQASTLPPLLKRAHDMAKRAKSSPKVEPLADTRQLDLFIADLLDYNIKDDAASMEAPLFTLATKPDLKIWKWESADGKRWLQVTPSVKGRATMHDKDLLIYLTSQLMAAMNEAMRNGTKLPGRRCRFTLHDYLKATDKNTGGRAYEAFEDSLDRLAGTRLKTNIAIEKISARDSFGLIERYKILQAEDRQDKRMVAVEVTLSEWLYSAIENKGVLTISRDYFSLRKPLEKRLYELARKHVGAQPDWNLREQVLYEKTGSQATYKEFCRMFRDIIASDSVPDYRFSRSVADGENWVRVYQKDTKKLVAGMTKKPRQPKK